MEKAKHEVTSLLMINADLSGDKLAKDILDENFSYDLVVSPTILKNLTDKQIEDLKVKSGELAEMLFAGLVVHLNKLLNGEVDEDGSVDSTNIE